MNTCRLAGKGGKGNLSNLGLPCIKKKVAKSLWRSPRAALVLVTNLLYRGKNRWTSRSYLTPDGVFSRTGKGVDGGGGKDF